MNKLIHADVIDGMSTLDDESIHLLVTSPPYGVGMNYDQGDIETNQYWNFTDGWLSSVFTKLIPGGYACINIPLSTYSFGTGFLPKFYHIARCSGYADIGILVSWVKRFNDSGRLYNKRFDSPTYNGRLKFSFASEVIIIFRTPGLYRDVGIDLTPYEQNMWGVNVWDIQPEADRTHPAPFPVELPHRLIKIFSNPDDVVLDPFVGSGSSLVAAQQLGRAAIGIDNSLKYLEQTHTRLSDSTCELRHLANGTVVCAFSVAINETWMQNDKKQERVSYFDCQAWTRLAEIINEHFRKGQPIFLDGSLRQERWETEEGQKRSKVIVNVQHVMFLPRSGDNKDDTAQSPSSRKKDDTGRIASLGSSNKLSNLSMIIPAFVPLYATMSILSLD